MTTARELVVDLQDLVSLPEAYLHVRALLRDPGSGMEDFARAVRNDPAITARVLRVANSAFFGVSRKVETVTMAISLMGVTRLHDLVLSTAVIGAFDRLPLPRVDLPSFWRRSIHTGIVARMLAEQGGIFDSERLFVAGLLQDIGHLLMYLRIPLKANSALARSRELEQPLAMAERADIGFHYGEVGAALIDAWQLPESLQIVCAHHDTPSAAPGYHRECSLVHIARLRVLGGADDAPHSLPFVEPVHPQAYTSAQIAEAAVDQVMADSYQHLAEAMELLISKT